ncbi:MAG: EscU/YscU/HrcU family type III secretion system export apparatus switch protein [Spirochaetales bacterium]|nr:EscU/YscU/HrcU family type III secretion system export apparatus switch protein [Spirochaetales bacterium]
MGLEKGAAALKWDREKDEAPRLIASGKGYLAEKILELADEAGIPLVQQEPLANLLLTLPPGREIPQELFALAAEVYVFLMELDSSIRYT